MKKSTGSGHGTKTTGLPGHMHGHKGGGSHKRSGGGKHSQQHHHGPVLHPDMHSYIDGHGTADPDADALHNEMNMAHGVGAAGMSPQGDYCEGGEGETEGLHGGNMEGGGY